MPIYKGPLNLYTVGEYRFDIGQLAKPKRLPDGRVLAQGRLTRSGVFKYRNYDGSIRREYRPPDEVFKSDSLDSLKFAPVTDDHPTDFVSLENYRDTSKGTVGESIKRDSNFVVASLSFTDKELITKLDTGKVQLSCGYVADMDYTPGVTPGGDAYDAIQRNITYNHVAVVDTGRAGPLASVRVDSTDAEMVEDIESENVNAVGEKEKTKMDEELLKQSLSAAKQRIDELTDTVNALKKTVDTQTARADAAEAERVEAKNAEQNSIKFDEAVKSRVDLLRLAEKILDSGDLELSDKEIKLKAIEKITSKKIDVDKSDEYVDAFFDSIRDRVDSVENTDVQLKIAASNTSQSKAPETKIDDGEDIFARYAALQRREEVGE